MITSHDNYTNTNKNNILLAIIMILPIDNTVTGMPLYGYMPSRSLSGSISNDESQH